MITIKEIALVFDYITLIKLSNREGVIVKKINCVAFLFLFILGGCSDEEGFNFRVMTRNLYLGADPFKILEIQDLKKLPIAVSEVLKMVNDTNFHARAEAIAEEIKRTNPHLVGLQEVSVFRIQNPGDFLSGNPVPADHIYLDYLDILMNALEEKGLEYEVISAIENFDQEFPMAAPNGNGGLQLNDIRLTDRDVILKKSGIETRDVQEVYFQTKLQIPLGAITINVVRSYASVIAKVDGLEYQFVNTHLEISDGFPEIQAAQASEMVRHLTNTDTKIPIILVGDFQFFFRK